MHAGVGDGPGAELIVQPREVVAVVVVAVARHAQEVRRVRHRQERGPGLNIEQNEKSKRISEIPISVVLILKSASGCALNIKSFKTAFAVARHAQKISVVWYFQKVRAVILLVVTTHRKFAESGIVKNKAVP